MLLKFRIDRPPPSGNKHMRPDGQGGLYRNKKESRWESDAILQMRLQANGLTLPKPCYWRAQIHIPRRLTAADCDNLGKDIHDALHKSGVVPDDRYLVKTSSEFWAGDHLLIYVKQERLETWAKIMNPSKSLMRRLAKSGY